MGEYPGQMSHVADILLLSDASDHVYTWARMLTGGENRLWQGEESLPADAQVDVIVTDQVQLARDVSSPRLKTLLANGRIGLILVGQGGPADVHLPADCSKQEIREFCRLLAENIRLRRECRRHRRVQRMLNQLAFTDPLTGLPNRRAWDDELLRRWGENDQGVCLALLDLDHFKVVNDRFGHLAGDEVLREVARALSQQAGDHDFIARLGGDEFGLLLGCDPADQLDTSLDTLRAEVCRPAPHGPITASLGYADPMPPSVRSADLVFQAADRALRQAKSAGRNRCQRGEINASPA